MFPGQPIKFGRRGLSNCETLLLFKEPAFILGDGASAALSSAFASAKIECTTLLASNSTGVEPASGRTR